MPTGPRPARPRLAALLGTRRWPLPLLLPGGRGFCIGLVEPMRTLACRHNQRVGGIEFEADTALIRPREHFNQFVAGKPGEVVERLDAVPAERNQHAGA